MLNMCSQADIFEIIRSCVPYYFVFVLPILIIIYPSPVSSSVEFPVFRSQQFELHGSTYGSQSSLVNVEARVIESEAYARRCVIARMADLSPAKYQHIINQGAAALLILLPNSFQDLSFTERQLFYQLEEAIITTEAQLAVYFAYETNEIKVIYDSVRSSSNIDKASSAMAALVSSLSSDGYQMVVSASQSKRLADPQLSNIYGRLTGFGVEEEMPTIAIVAHYDAFGVAPELSFGADSNGSGVVALLEIARVLSMLYSSPRTHPKVNIVFLLSSGAYVNYQGAKRFLEDQLDSSDSPMLSELQFALCLDTLANGRGLNLHVSKKPKEDSAGHLFYESLSQVGQRDGIPVEMIHKKINLQDDQQSWEHEKFSLRRLPGLTLSRLNSSKTKERGSITDVFDELDRVALTSHVSVIVRGIIQYIYNVSADNICQEELAVTSDSIDSWISMLSTQPRSAQLLLGKNNALVLSLQHILSRYVGEVSVSSYKADRRDPDWVFYDITNAQMSAYAIKAASFDFFLMMAIMSYLGAVYFCVQNFHHIFSYMTKISSNQRLRIY